MIEFDWGRCLLTATPESLVVSLQADDSAALARGRELIGHRIETIGHRERLTVTWEPEATG